MNVLLVGAGAVGQVYGHAFQRGGARIAFLVKPPHAAATRAGFTLYPVRRRGAPEPVRLEGFGTYTSVSEVSAAGPWDAVVLCVPSPALRAGTWLAELAAAAGDATFVVLQPGVDERATVAAHVPAERIVCGMIGLASWAAPLSGEALAEPGTAWWVPPLGGCPLSGPAERVRPLARALKAGGLPAKVARDVGRSTAFGTALLQTQITALESAGWSFDRLLADRDLGRLAHRAAREALAVTARVRGERVPFGPRLLGRRVLGLVLRLARRAAPMDLEAFFRRHYTKVAGQSQELLASWSAAAAAHALAHGALDDLRARVAP